MTDSTERFRHCAALHSGFCQNLSATCRRDVAICAPVDIGGIVFYNEGVAKVQFPFSFSIFFAMRYLTLLFLVPFFTASFAEVTPAQTIKWEKIVVSDRFFGEGAAIGDFNNDGILDVAIGHYWYEGPDFRTRHQFYGAESGAQDYTYGPNDPTRYSNNFGMFVGDFNGDGWIDILVCPMPGEQGYWYENPKNAPGLWKRHPVTIELGNESQFFADILGTGRKSLLFNRNGWLGLATPNPERPYEPWDFLAISNEDGRFQRFTHGVGYGDITGNGRMDILERTGWWEQPDNPTQTPWKFHPFHFADAAAHILVFDVDGDGLNDVVTALECHMYGLAWYRQVRDRDGNISFEQHVLIPRSNVPFNPAEIDFPAVSQLHALVAVDINGDGIMDFVTGKRVWAHGPTGDVSPGAPAILMWWETVRDGQGGATFVPHIIDEDSGVGTQFAVGDLNGDGIPDIVIGNKKGAFVFLSVKE